MTQKPASNTDKPVAGEKKRVRLTQKAIVETAAELFARQGFGATSLDDIAERLGATKGALYYHVKNKEEILRLIYLTVLNASEEPLHQLANSLLPPAQKLRQAIEHHTGIAANRSPAMTVFYREQHHLSGPFAREILLRKKAYERYFEQIIAEGQKAGLFTATIDAKIAAFGLLGMCNWLSQWYQASGQYSASQIAEMFAAMVEHGLLASSPAALPNIF
jgi:TetR/AcrR family transcriptional regulator, cholesterol catabolism regulator